MREKLNSNPMAQVGVVAVLLVAAAFLLISSMGGSEEEEAATTEATVAVAGTGASGTATGATPGEAVEGAVEEAAENASAEASAEAAPSAIPTSIKTPPPPKPVREAYADGKTVVLLIVHDGGIDDKLVAQASQGLRSMEEVALFVVPASQIYRYASITLGVEVSRVPALVVMRPRRLSDGTPQATVTYGFQTSQGVVQAVHDAAYDGPADTYHPG